MAYGLTPVSLWLVTTEAIGSLEEILVEDLFAFRGLRLSGNEVPGANLHPLERIQTKTVVLLSVLINNIALPRLHVPDT